MIFFDLLLLTLQPIDSLNDIHEDIFQPNKEIVIMEMWFTGNICPDADLNIKICITLQK